MKVGFHFLRIIPRPAFRSRQGCKRAARFIHRAQGGLPMQSLMIGKR